MKPMKKLISLLLIVAFITMGASLAEGALVTYFSHAGENYNVGVIEEGNTAKLAKVIAEQTGADLFEIVPVVDYPQSYDECLEVATAEQREGARPEYVGDIENWDQYDTVFIGYPIWWRNRPASGSSRGSSPVSDSDTRPHRSRLFQLRISVCSSCNPLSQSNQAPDQPVQAADNGGERNRRWNQLHHLPLLHVNAVPGPVQILRSRNQPPV